MTKLTNSHRFAGTAIAAVLAFGSTPLWAQDIAPTAAPPAPVSASVAPPAIVLPPIAAPAAPVAVAPEPVVAAPAPERVERPAPRAAAPVARSAPQRATVERTVTPQVAPVDAAPVTPVAAAAPTAPTAIDTTPTEQPIVEETATAAPADTNSSDILPIAGMLAALGLGGIALFATRRRRRNQTGVVEPIVTYEPEPALPPRAMTPDVAPVPLPTTQAQVVRPAWQEPRRANVSPDYAQASQLNREALLNRMVAAQPDANNPFTSGKARRRRARLMLQSMDDNRWDDSAMNPGFDWREQARATRELETVSN